MSKVPEEEVPILETKPKLSFASRRERRWKALHYRSNRP
jgi:hypothetical protein